MGEERGESCRPRRERDLIRLSPKLNGSRGGRPVKLAMGSHEDFLRSLAKEELQLLVLRKVLYEGRWEEMEKDLIARRDGRPFIFKLQTRIDEDLKRIGVLRAYEQEHGVDLQEYVSSGTDLSNDDD